MIERKVHLIMELDNVLYDFANYYLNISEFIANLVSDTFGIDKEYFLSAFISKLKNSIFVNNDYTYITYELLKELKRNPVSLENNGARVSLINSIKTKFNQARLRYLKFFPGSITLLKNFKESKIGIIGLTNSPARVVKQRIKLFEIDKYFDVIYCLQDSFSGEDQGYENEDSPEGIWFHSICNNVSSLMCDIVEFPSMYQKPSKRILLRILEDEKIPEENVIVIGNSIENDILPARLLKMKAILVDIKTKILNRKTLSRFMKDIPVKQLRKILNLPNNKPLLPKVENLTRVSSIPELIYAFEDAKIIA
ncbi:MAG: HAD hydrolase-like protein [Brevinematia bacterium]